MIIIVDARPTALLFRLAIGTYNWSIVRIKELKEFLVFKYMNHWTGIMPGISELELTTYQMCYIWTSPDWHSGSWNRVHKIKRQLELNEDKLTALCLSRLWLITATKLITNKHHHRTNCSTLVVVGFHYILLAITINLIERLSRPNASRNKSTKLQNSGFQQSLLHEMTIKTIVGSHKAKLSKTQSKYVDLINPLELNRLNTAINGAS